MLSSFDSVVSMTGWVLDLSLSRFPLLTLLLIVEDVTDRLSVGFSDPPSSCCVVEVAAVFAVVFVFVLVVANDAAAVVGIFLRRSGGCG